MPVQSSAFPLDEAKALGKGRALSSAQEMVERGASVRERIPPLELLENGDALGGSADLEEGVESLEREERLVGILSGKIGPGLDRLFKIANRRVVERGLQIREALGRQPDPEAGPRLALGPLHRNR